MKFYIGSPSIVRLPDGRYLASHDFFGKETTSDVTHVYVSADRGETWARQGEIKGQFWSTLFLHDDALYIIGASAEYGYTVIRRSDDDGQTWTSADSPDTGLLLSDGRYHCAPVPIIRHQGRLWRAMEDAGGPGGWGSHFRAFVMSVPEDADLLDAANWTFSNRLEFKPEWYKKAQGVNLGWLEGNVVLTPESKVVNILRVVCPEGETAAWCDVSDDGKTISFDPDTGFIHLPGGRTKFTIRFDEESGRYWSLVNKQRDPEANRNILVLVSSADLRDWRVERLLLEHPDTEHHAFQYVDWLFENRDIIVASRTAWDGSHSFHDANFMTFHRIEAFRS